MNNKDIKSFINDAGVAGLILGTVTTAFLFTGMLIPKISMPAVVSRIFVLILWAVKFWFCIKLMQYFLTKAYTKYDQINKNNLLLYGTMIAFFSALIYAAAQLVNILFISNEEMLKAINTSIAQMYTMMDSNTKATISKTLRYLPQITFISNLIYCFIYGTILSFILTNLIFKNNTPFAD